MIERGVRVAYRSKIVEIEVKKGRVRPLLGVSFMWVKAYVHRQDPTYACPFPRT